MVRIIVAALALGLAGTAWAQKKDCAELKGELGKIIQHKGHTRALTDG